MRLRLLAWTLALLCGACLAWPVAAGTDPWAGDTPAASAGHAAGDATSEPGAAPEAEPGTGETDVTASGVSLGPDAPCYGTPVVPQCVAVPGAPWLGGLLRPPRAA